MITLRPYQIEARDAVLAEWNKENLATLLASGTGTGKTEIYLAVLERDMNSGRALIVAHRQELIYQPKDRILAHWPKLGRPGIVMAGQDEYQAKVVIATIQTLSANGRLDRILSAGKITHLVTDECFVAGTLVGGRPIETLKVGDRVPAFDSGFGNSEPGYVTRTFVNPTPDVLYEIEIAGTSLVCTANHPFYHGTNMWKKASALQIGDYVVQCIISNPEQGSVSHAENENLHLQLVRQGVSERSQMEARSISKSRTGLLLQGVQQGISEQKKLGDNGPDKSRVRIGENEAKQSDASAREQGKNANDFASYGMEALSTRGERETASSCTATLGMCLGMGDRVPSTDGGQASEPPTLANLLQDRHCQPRVIDWDRDRWEESSLLKATEARSQEETSATRARVDNITVLKRGRDQRFTEVCPGGFVYNIEVSPWNNYLANGIVVHNCHHSTADTYRELYAKMHEHNPKLRHLGVTATPRRTDKEPLRDIYDSVAYRMGIKKSIKIGALVSFVAWSFQLPVSIANVHEVGDGWDDGELGDVLKARNAEEIIIEMWRKHAERRPTICFTASVAQAHSLAAHFREYGYAFEAVDGTTRNRDRKTILHRFQSGEIQGIVNCALWTEGFDAPHASCLVQVRPTRSDLVYVQMAGRVLRRAPGKNEALLLDFVPEDARDLRLAGDLLGKPQQQKKREQKAEQQGIVLGCFGINSDGDGIDGDPDEVIMTVLDYLSASRLAWTFDGLLASATVEAKNSLAVVMPDPVEQVRLEKANALKEEDRWQEAWNAEYERVRQAANYRLYQINRGTSLIGCFDSWDTATDAAEDWCDTQEIDVLGKKSSSWRRQSASDKQEALLLKFGKWEEGMSRGKAAQALTHYFARKALRL